MSRFWQQTKYRFNSCEKRFAACFTLISSMVIVTPLCGFLFQCGCDWPGWGLDAACNYYKTDVVHKCPWCASAVTGIVSTGLSFTAAIWTSIVKCPALDFQNSVSEVFLRCLFALIIFVLLATLTAGLAAEWQGYPLG